jgi:hypothetical protein
MVNTFITAGPHDIDPKTGKKGFRISAANLDKSRLWKQALEATQILNLVESFHVLGQMFSSPCPTNPYLIKAWTREIMAKYKKLDSYLFLHQGAYVWYSKDNDKPLKIKYDDEYTINDDGSILYKNKKYPKYTLILPLDRFVSMGFWSHPVVIMWMLHPDSLKLYINDHIEEFLERGGKPGTKKMMYKIDTPIENIVHPIWSTDVKFHANHKAALLTKEIVRKEKEWYIFKDDFKVAYDSYINNPPVHKAKTTSSFEYYIWPFTQDIDNPRYKFVM